jgi:hypothetical protein
MKTIRGFAISALVIWIAVAVLGVGSVAYYQTQSSDTMYSIVVGKGKEKNEIQTDNTDVGTLPVQTNTSAPENVSYMIRSSSNDIVTETSMSISSQSAQENYTLPLQSVSNTNQQSALDNGWTFTDLEQELMNAQASGKSLSPEHYERVMNDLSTLENRGYEKNAIDNLRVIATSLAPYIQDSSQQKDTNNDVFTTETSVHLETTTIVTTFNNSETDQSPSSSRPSCVSNPSPIFSNHITDMNKVNYVVPPPTMGSGPSLKPHSYIGTDHAFVPIYSPVNMTLQSGSHYEGGPYSFDFQVSCEVSLRFGHVTDPVDILKNELPIEPAKDSRTKELSPIQFKAGELIAYTTGTQQAGNWDYGVYNASTTNRYVDDPDWNDSRIYTTAVCPFEYFTPDLKMSYTTKFNSTILGGNPPHGASFCL